MQIDQLKRARQKRIMLATRKFFERSEQGADSGQCFDAIICDKRGIQKARYLEC